MKETTLSDTTVSTIGTMLLLFHSTLFYLKDDIKLFEKPYGSHRSFYHAGLYTHTTSLPRHPGTTTKTAIPSIMLTPPHPILLLNTLQNKKHHPQTRLRVRLCYTRTSSFYPIISSIQHTAYPGHQSFRDLGPSVHGTGGVNG